MATPVSDEQAETIDAYFGDGVFDTWHGFDVEADMQLSRKKKADTSLWHLDHGFAVLSPYGTDWVEKLQNDCAWAIDLIKQKKFPDPAQFNPLLKIFPVALDAADLMLSDAEAIPVTWLMLGAAVTPSVGLAAAAGQIQRELLELDDLLSDAMAEEVEVEIKSFLGVAITTFELFTPGLGWLALASTTAAEAILSGYNTPVGGTKYAAGGAEAIEKLEIGSHKVQHVAGRGGKLLTIAGFYFDVDEVLSAKGNVKKIKSLMEDAKKKFDGIQGALNLAIRGYQRLNHILNTTEADAQKEIELEAARTR